MIYNLKLSNSIKPRHSMSGGGGGGGTEIAPVDVNQKIWGAQASQLDDMYDQLGQQGQWTNENLQRRATPAKRTINQIGRSGQAGWNDQLQGGVYQGMDLQNNLMNSLNQSMAGPSNTQEINNMIMGGAGNNYADAMRGQYIDDANAAQQNMLQNLDARANAAGMSGGSRQGIAQAQGMQNINKNLQSNLAQVGYDSFDKDLNRKLQIAGMADQNTLQRQGMLQDMLGQQQQGIQGAISNTGQQQQTAGMARFAPYMIPGQGMSQYANTLGRPVVLSNAQGGGGNIASGGGSGGSMLGTIGSVGGGIVGGMYGGSGGAYAGSQLGGAAGNSIG